MVFAGNWSGFLPKFGKELGLFRLIIQRSNLVGRTLNLDGGTRPPTIKCWAYPNQKFWVRQWIGDRLKKIFEDLFFLESTCACVLGPWPWPWAFLSLASRGSVFGKAVLGLGLGLERFCLRKGCPWPWPWPRIFFVSLALALASSLVSSTPPLIITNQSSF